MNVCPAADSRRLCLGTGQAFSLAVSWAGSACHGHAAKNGARLLGMHRVNPGYGYVDSPAVRPAGDGKLGDTPIRIGSPEDQGHPFCSVMLWSAGLCLIPLVLTCAGGDASGWGSGGGWLFASVCPEPACTLALAHDDLLVQGDERTCVQPFHGFRSWLDIRRSSRGHFGGQNAAGQGWLGLVSASVS